jgi:hypothetical protein
MVVNRFRLLRLPRHTALRINEIRVATCDACEDHLKQVSERDAHAIVRFSYFDVCMHAFELYEGRAASPVFRYVSWLKFNSQAERMQVVEQIPAIHLAVVVDRLKATISAETRHLALESYRPQANVFASAR